MLLGGSATKKLNRRKREVGVVLGVILNRAIDRGSNGGVDMGRKPSRKRE